MSTVAEEFTHIVDVDTHAKTHTYAILVSTTGHVTATGTFPASPAGISRALAWDSRRTTGKSSLFSVEGASSYGAGLTRALTAARLPVCDVRPPRTVSPVSVVASPMKSTRSPGLVRPWAPIPVP